MIWPTLDFGATAWTPIAHCTAGRPSPLGPAPAWPRHRPAARSASSAPGPCCSRCPIPRCQPSRCATWASCASCHIADDEAHAGGAHAHLRAARPPRVIGDRRARGLRPGPPRCSSAARRPGPPTGSAGRMAARRCANTASRRPSAATPAASQRRRPASMARGRLSGSRRRGRPIRIHPRRPVTAAAPACPRCGSPRTERLMAFGATACKALHHCLDCREPFEHFKPI